jgi:hypothetical protein
VLPYWRAKKVRRRTSLCSCSKIERPSNSGAKRALVARPDRLDLIAVELARIACLTGL